ncbi:MAG: hypothetical protein ACOCYR_08880 [Erythrobacter sp.]|uniref:hypothetical protein n=1 Tax=Erythrobacter sp. HL-111 TaxID=1798193 RepID=UPI0006D9614E|nr:hypothetical protein [Erythrobacter sp. HL-111]KPP91209.1 MAG: hypothetical protein HLUCCO15_08320 [Erythrobacteraceae bacterium HL-111]SDT05749.1 hypothetical protein SAMN04515621_2815 [Erythrobacter sp. HL-111]
MLRSLIGATVGSKMAKRYPVLGGATGVVVARAAPFILKRISIPAMLAMGAGGYLAKRYFDKQDGAESGQSRAGNGGMKARPTDGPDSDTGTIIDNPPGGALQKTDKTPPTVN